MSEYIITCDDEVATWVGNDVESMKRIVRCRDCKHLIAHGTGCAYWDYCDIENIDGFCAWGERRWLTCKCGHEMESEGRCPMCGRYVREDGDAR